MKQILIVKPGSISSIDKHKIEKSEIVIIEMENPQEARVITTLDTLEGDDLIDCFVKALSGQYSNKERELFGLEFLRKLTNKKLKNT